MYRVAPPVLNYGEIERQQFHALSSVQRRPDQTDNYSVNSYHSNNSYHSLNSHGSFLSYEDIERQQARRLKELAEQKKFQSMYIPNNQPEDRRAVIERQQTLRMNEIKVPKKPKKRVCFKEDLDLNGSDHTLDTEASPVAVDDLNVFKDSPVPEHKSEVNTNSPSKERKLNRQMSMEEKKVQELTQVDPNLADPKVQEFMLRREARQKELKEKALQEQLKKEAEELEIDLEKGNKAKKNKGPIHKLKKMLRG